MFSLNASMRVSFVTTVYNEESAIKPLLKSLFSQSKFLEEIIIVDGGSTDSTLSVISNFILSKAKGQISNKQIKFKIIVRKGNRSVGRNEAIKNSSNEIIVCSDAGCILDKNWIKNITRPFNNSGVDVVAGYYQGIAETIFQKCLIPYVLVMPDRINADNFLPATRSMAFKKSIWKKVNGFPEQFSDNEDYVFAKKLKKANANIVFEKKAIVNWAPRRNMEDAFIMFYRFAKGDAESHIFRPKVFLIFLRYLIVLIILFLFFILRSNFIIIFLYLMFFAYVFWSIVKNYKYVKDIRAIFFLPLIQITSDIAVTLGTVMGLFSFVDFD